MRNKRTKVFLMSSIIFMMVKYGVRFIARRNPSFIEVYYSRGLYKGISHILNTISNVFPFSFGETVIVCAFLFLLYNVLKGIYKLFRKQFKEGLYYGSVALLIITFNLFYYDFAWGLNNYRHEIEVNFEYEEEEITIEELTDLYKDIIVKTNELKESLSLLSYKTTKIDIFKCAYEGYEPLHEVYPFISDKKVIAKPLKLSANYFNSGGITGIYLYLVAEPNVNHLQPIYTLPYTACHEIAHQKGFAYEDEANFIGFLACRENDNLLVQYSGYYGILKYVGNTIYKYDQDLYFELYETLSDDVKADMRAEREYWDESINEKVEEVQTQMNDAYLKANNQKEGVLSYSRVVELLVYDYLKHNGI